MSRRSDDANEGVNQAKNSLLRNRRRWPATNLGLLTSGAMRWGATVELGLAVTAGALWTTRHGTAAYARSVPGPWPALLLVLMWAVRLTRSLPTAQGRADLRPPSFALPLAVFLLSALVSVQVAYDPGPAEVKAWLIVGAIGIYWAMAGQPDLKQLLRALGLWVIAGTGVAAHFLLTNNWDIYPVPLPLFVQLARSAASFLPVHLAGEALNPNDAAGILAVLLPFFVPLIAWLLPCTRRPTEEPVCSGQPTPRRRSPCLVLASIALGIVLLGGLMTMSRGAWLALGLTAGLWGLWHLAQRLPWRIRLATLAMLTVFGSLALWAAIQALLSSSLDGFVGAAREDVANRMMLAELGALLARDTPFTGIGLGMFETHFSIYSLLIHVGFIEHSHSMLINLAIEQGLPGAVAYGTAMVTAVAVGVRELGRSTRSQTWQGGVGEPGSEGEASSSQVRLPQARSSTPHRQLVIESALASVTVIFINGLVNDPFYGSPGALLLFVPFGVLVAAIRAGPGTHPSAKDSPAPPGWRTISGSHLAPLAILVLTSVSLVVARAGVQEGPFTPWSRIQAAWHANAGVIAEARCELSVYDQEHFDDPTVDQVRRHLDLAEAVAHFEAALAHDPTQVTATQRLAAIALARGQYGDALQMMRDLWVSGHRDRVTRLLYGDALTAAGQVDEAVAAVRGISFAKPRLLGQAWSRHLDDDSQREIWTRDAAEKLSD